MRNPGAEAERPISTGWRGLACADFFGFGGVAVAGTDFEPSGKSEAVQINAFFVIPDRGSLVHSGPC
jgi:hypothetical protein